MPVSIMRSKGQITIPLEVRRAAHLEEGDPVEIQMTSDGILIRPKKVIDSTQAWFWTPERRAASNGSKATRSSWRLSTSEIALPTYEVTARFLRDLAALTPKQRKALMRAVAAFVGDLQKGKFRSGLRVKGVQGAQGIFEMTWADDGRATFQYGPRVREREPHVIWRRVGTHSILGNP
jgi:AbrB family looped-hinge helix DNA binding protein